MIKKYKYEFYEKIKYEIFEKIKENIDIGIILGTGLTNIIDDDKIIESIDFEQIENFPKSTVKSHTGKILFAKISSKNVLIFTGRFHYYEGYSHEEVAIPIYVLKLLGAKSIIMTNASGAVSYDINVGDICIIKDHINFNQISPTRGENLDQFGKRFFSLNNAYDKEYIKLAKKIAKDEALELKEAVYFNTVGPFFETPAEIKAMRILGADLVGMSTVTEAIACAHCNIKLICLSFASNLSSDRIDDHSVDDVYFNAKKIECEFKKLILKLIEEIN